MGIDHADDRKKEESIAQLQYGREGLSNRLLLFPNRALTFTHRRRLLLNPLIRHPFLSAWAFVQKRWHTSPLMASSWSRVCRAPDDQSTDLSSENSCLRIASPLDTHT